MLFPVPGKDKQYALYSDQAMLDMAVQWLDVDVVRQLLRFGRRVFDVNHRSEQFGRRTYLMQISSGKLDSELQMKHNTGRFMRLCAMLCEHEDIDLELEDAEGRTALAHATKEQQRVVGRRLLVHGAEVNHASVRRAIQETASSRIFRIAIKELRKEWLEALQEVLGLGRVDSKIHETILNFVVSEWKKQ